jgi:signal transduction histidine kinase
VTARSAAWAMRGDSITGDGHMLDLYDVALNEYSDAVERLRTLSRHRHTAEVALTVADTGMGIPEGEKQALFARFFRATNAIRHAVPGTGLGLAIVHTIVGNHGGTIEVDSTENVGTTVTVRLPAGT